MNLILAGEALEALSAFVFGQARLYLSDVLRDREFNVLTSGRNR